MKKLLLGLLLLFVVSPLEAQNQQSTVFGTQVSPQRTILATMTTAGSRSWEVATGMVNHALTYSVSPSITGLTVTWTASTDGGVSFPTTCGSSTSTGAATITCAGTYNAMQVTTSAM